MIRSKATGPSPRKRGCNGEPIACTRTKVRTAKIASRDAACAQGGQRGKRRGSTAAQKRTIMAIDDWFQRARGEAFKDECLRTF